MEIVGGMNSYISGYKVSNKSDSGSLKRFAQAMKSDAIVKGASEKEEFGSGYNKGVLRFAVANKFMRLSACGLDTYMSDGDGLFWKRDGDSIYRVESDLSWVDEFLNNEGNNENS